jgi:hypothetical protein
MWDVLEHVRDPLWLLSGLRVHSCPQTLLFVSVPSGSAFGTREKLPGFARQK